MRADAVLLALLAAGCAGSHGAVARPLPPNAEPGAAAPAPPLEPGSAPAVPAALTLDAVAAAAELASPRLAMARDEVEAAAGRTEQAGLLPNPSLVTEYEGEADHGLLSKSKATIGVEQAVVASRRLEYASASAAAAGDARTAEIEAARRDVRAAARAAFLELVYLRDAEALTRELSATANASADLARARFQAKVAVESEVVRTEIAVAEFDVKIAGFARRRAAAEANLSSLLGGMTVRTGDLAGTLDPAAAAPPLAELAKRVREAHPSLVALRREREAAGLATLEAKAGRWKDPTVRLAVGRDGIDEAWVVEAGIELPLPIYDANQGRIREAQALAARAFHAEDAVTLDLLAALTRAYGDFAAAAERLAALRSRLLPAAERSLAAAREAYRAGKAGTLDVLDAQRTFAEARLTELELLRDLNVANAEIRRIAGDEP